MINTMDIQKRFESTPLWQTLGFEFIRAENGEAETALNFNEGLTNVSGTLHGGMMMTMLDNTMGIAAYTLGFDTVMTIQMETRFIRPVTNGRVHAFAHTIERTRTTIILEGRIYDEDQKLIALCTATFKGMHHA